MSRIPDSAPSEPSNFDHLPILTAYTVCDGDGTHVIDDCTDRFRERLGRCRSTLVGHPLEQFYETDGVPEPSADRDRGRDRTPRSDGGDSVPADGSMPGPGSVVASAGDRGGGWQPAAAERALVAADGRLIHTVAESIPRQERDGYVVVHVDVTRRKRREKQVAALNRLLRHNVRNDLNLLRGHVRTLRDHGDEPVFAAADVIGRIADRWLGLAETGRKLERLSRNVSPRAVTVSNLGSAVRAAVERDSPEGTVAVEFDGVAPDREVSEQWYAPLVELCENGIKHAVAEQNGSATVTVTVSAADRPGWIAIAVADEGPGIPAEERATLLGDAETPLRHGSGLGLWLVRFVVEQFGGCVAVRDRDPAGSVVELTVPVAHGE